jgi:hypothetical protein
MAQNKLIINSDFRVFADMVARWEKDYGGYGEIIDDAVRKWFEQALIETVIGVQALKDPQEWTVEHIGYALSEEALTSAVMQRYHITINLRRELGSKLGRVPKTA